ncbi:MAG: hypothetical protein IT364_21730 [Candidatus Hydrogenedentes bacterium]|nr:hypothetical protein [Candidatus Hydrogenedentota bacterium]
MGMFATLFLAVLYVGSYISYREAHTEYREQDGREYVIFPPDSLAWYYVYRPASYLDGRLTGMGFHIGPH